MPRTSSTTSGASPSGNAIVVTDVGQHQMWEAQYYKHETPRSLITSGGLGTMGFALPAAIGAKVARPDAEVWVVVGDAPDHPDHRARTAPRQSVPEYGFAGQTAECEAGNEPYSGAAADIGNAPGNQGLKTEQTGQTKTGTTGKNSGGSK